MAASAIAASPKVELRDVGLRYFGLEGETEALKGISISIAPGEFVAIIGQSGCGKSTLLSLISGILMPTDGSEHSEIAVARGFELAKLCCA